ncbi:MAG: MFS transporter [Gammaproteobacteria bacterium]|nr:MFS transporter [Gammaproteobacteria bacterium]NNC96855.1 MFS transporter [Gammaproteobacteria bacterium]NNM12699.1 MFS transporter [Gammaproteobacteria bacterium]
MTVKQKPRLSFWQIWNMSFGFLGIQFGFALQGGFMSRIFQTLGAEQNEIPLLWIAAPLTGLLVQPIIGYMSDRTWSWKFGRRRPYFLIGAVLSSLALFWMPYSSALWMAAGFLWILDASINISMEPFRALVADNLPKSQRSYGFVVQTFIIGIGTYIASSLPWIVSKLGVSDAAAPGVVPESVKVAFAIGAFVFMISILITVITTKEYSPEELDSFSDDQESHEPSSDGMVTTIKRGYSMMSPVMLKLGVVQFFSWFAFFTMWSMANPALTEHVFEAPAPVAEQFDMAIIAQAEAFNTQNTAFQKASNGVGAYMGIYGLSSMVFAFLLVLYTAKRRINRKYLHMVSLILGGLGFMLMKYIPDPGYLTLCFILIGIAWASILSMPYAMLSTSVDPKKMGLMMGLFNMFIVIPQIIASLGGVNFTSGLLGDAPIHAMTVAGVCLVLAGLSNFLITEPEAISYQE